MAKRIDRIEVITCDLCDEVCTPLTKRQLAADLRERKPGSRKNLAIINFTAFAPRELDKPDVCNTCARLAFTKLLDSIPV